MSGDRWYTIAYREHVEDENGFHFVTHGRFLYSFDLANVGGTFAVLLFRNRDKAETFARDAREKEIKHAPMLAVMFRSPQEMIVRLGELMDDPTANCDSVIVDHTYGKLTGQIGNIEDIIIAVGKQLGYGA